MSEKRFLGLVLALYAFLGLGYSVAVPIWEASDEPSHYQLALAIARGEAVPRSYRNYEASQPRLYYWLASVPIALLDAVDPEWVVARMPPLTAALAAREPGGLRSNAYRKLPSHEPFDGLPVFDWNERNHRFLLGPHVLRWLNLLLGGLAAYLVYCGARRFAPDPPEIPRAAFALTALTPQYLHVCASVSNDALGMLAGAGLFWMLGALGDAGPRLRVAALGLALVAPFATKLTVAPMSIAVLLAVAWSARSGWLPHWRRILALTLPLAAVALFAASGLERFERLVWRVLDVHDAAGTLWGAGLESFARSYWGVVGWMSLDLPFSIWIPLTFAGSLGVAAALALGASSSTAPRLRRPRVAGAGLGLLLVAALLNSWLAIAWALALAGCLYAALLREDAQHPVLDREVWLWIALSLLLGVATKNMLATLQAQGRYLFPGIGVISVLMVTGWRLLLPPGLRRALPMIVLLALLGANLLMGFAGLLPVYYQPFLG